MALFKAPRSGVQAPSHLPDGPFYINISSDEDALEAQGREEGCKPFRCGCEGEADRRSRDAQGLASCRPCTGALPRHPGRLPPEDGGKRLEPYCGPHDPRHPGRTERRLRDHERPMRRAGLHGLPAPDRDMRTGHAHSVLDWFSVHRAAGLDSLVSLSVERVLPVPSDPPHPGAKGRHDKRPCHDRAGGRGQAYDSLQRPSRQRPDDERPARRQERHAPVIVRTSGPLHRPDHDIVEPVCQRGLLRRPSQVQPATAFHGCAACTTDNLGSASLEALHPGRWAMLPRRRRQPRLLRHPVHSGPLLPLAQGGRTPGRSAGYAVRMPGTGAIGTCAAMPWC